jgi:hypothetical protein
MHTHAILEGKALINLVSECLSSLTCEENYSSTNKTKITMNYTIIDLITLLDISVKSIRLH